MYIKVWEYFDKVLHYFFHTWMIRKFKAVSGSTVTVIQIKKYRPCHVSVTWYLKRFDFMFYAGLFGGFLKFLKIYMKRKKKTFQQPFDSLSGTLSQFLKTSQAPYHNLRFNFSGILPQPFDKLSGLKGDVVSKYEHWWTDHAHGRQILSIPSAHL